MCECKSTPSSVKTGAVIAIVELLLPLVDQENKVRLVQWAADNIPVAMIGP